VASGYPGAISTYDQSIADSNGTWKFLLALASWLLKYMKSQCKLAISAVRLKDYSLIARTEIELLFESLEHKGNVINVFRAIFSADLKFKPRSNNLKSNQFWKKIGRLNTKEKLCYLVNV
jgi:hypothetical protein